MSENAFVPGMGRDWLLPFYDPLTRLVGVGRLHKRLLDQAGIAPGARVLEIGCGTGNLALLTKRLVPAADVVGIDPDPKAVARARRKAGRGGLLVRFEVAYAEQLPFPEASFDTVLSALMLHHLRSDTKVRALQEARRVLRPGGSLHLVDFAAGEHHSAGLHGFLAKMVHARHGSGDHRAVVDLMRDAGLVDAQETAGQRTVLGRITFCKADRPSSAAPTAA